MLLKQFLNECFCILDYYIQLFLQLMSVTGSQLETFFITALVSDSIFSVEHNKCLRSDDSFGGAQALSLVLIMCVCTHLSVKMVRNEK